jgi:hypothetical protein
MTPGRVPLVVTHDPDEPGAGTIEVDGRVDGRSVRFRIDTGARRTQLGAPDLGLDPAEAAGLADGVPDSATSAGIFGSRTTFASVVGRLEVGPLAATDLEVQVDPTDDALRLLGMGVLGGHRIDLDVRGRRMTVDASGSDPASFWHPLAIDGGAHPLVPVDLDDRRVWAIWDTGAGVTIVDPTVVDVTSPTFVPLGSTQGGDASGTTIDVSLYRLTGCRIGGVPFGPGPCAAVPLPVVSEVAGREIGLILGYPVIAAARWVVDFTRGQWSVRRDRTG